MDWNDFFERTRVSAKVDSYSKLAPLLGITDGAIGHYRMGRRVPQVWVVADALRIQGHPEPEKQAIEIMKRAALTSPERTFWKRLAATAMALAIGVGFTLPRDVQASVGHSATDPVYIMRKSGTYGGVASSGILSRFDCNSNLTNSTNDVALPGRARAETVD